MISLRFLGLEYATVSLLIFIVLSVCGFGRFLKVSSSFGVHVWAYVAWIVRRDSPLG